MPLETEVLRGGEVVPLTWDYVTLSCMLTVAIKEGAPDYEFQEGRPYSSVPEGMYVDFSLAPIYYMDVKCDLWQKGRQTVKADHRFELKWEDDTERIIEFKQGDVFRMGRISKR